MEKPVDKNQTIDETKRKLKMSREELEGELEFQLQDIKKDAADIGKQIALVGGGLFIGWKILKALTKKKKDKKGKRHKNDHKSSSSKGNSIGRMIMHQVMTMVSVAVADQIKQALNVKQNKTVDGHKKNT